jgi:hypothetical protein
MNVWLAGQARYPARLGLLSLLVYLAVFTVVFAIATSVDASYTQTVDALAANRTHTLAKVTSVEPHNAICYQFVAANSIYTSCHRADYPGEESTRLSIGASVDIYYDPDDPSISCSCDPQPEAAGLVQGHLAFAIVAAILPALIITAGVVNRLQRRPMVPTKSDNDLPSIA